MAELNVVEESSPTPSSAWSPGNILGALKIEQMVLGYMVKSVKWSILCGGPNWGHVIVSINLGYIARIIYDPIWPVFIVTNLRPCIRSLLYQGLNLSLYSLIA